MGFTEAVRTVLIKKYATFSGRASRSEYWWFQLFYWAIAIAFIIVGISLIGPTDRQNGPSSSFIAVCIIGGLFVLAMLLPHTALQVRRFHDRNMSGWWYLAGFILSAVPYIGRGAGGAVFVVSMLRGTDGPNKYGPDPMRPEAIAEVFA